LQLCPAKKRVDEKMREKGIHFLEVSMGLTAVSLRIRYGINISILLKS
jgi:hypothetical protein